MILGVVTMLASFGFFGMSIWRAIAAKEALILPLELDRKTVTEWIEVKTSRNCMISVTTDFNSTSVQEEERFGETEYVLRYRFPVLYRVLDKQGNTIFKETRNAGWNEENRRVNVHYEEAERSGGSAVFEHYFAKFKVDPPGIIKIEIEVKPDSDYQAQINTLEMCVYDNVSKHTWSLLSGCFAFCLGPVVFLIGVILLFVGAMRSGKCSCN
jgi:hypothetical protein